MFVAITTTHKSWDEPLKLKNNQNKFRTNENLIYDP